MPDAAEYHILPENRANSIYCRDHVGLISEAHQAKKATV